MWANLSFVFVKQDAQKKPQINKNVCEEELMQNLDVLNLLVLQELTDFKQQWSHSLEWWL